MTATQVHPTPPPVVTGPPPVRRRSRALPNTIGAVLATVGAAVALAGGGLLAVAGNDGTIGSGTHDVSTPTSALVSQPATFEDMNEVASAIGQPRIGIKAEAK